MSFPFYLFLNSLNLHSHTGLVATKLVNAVLEEKVRGSIHSKRATDLTLHFGHYSVGDGKPLRSVSLEMTSGQICTALFRIHKARGGHRGF